MRARGAPRVKAEYLDLAAAPWENCHSIFMCMLKNEDEIRLFANTVPVHGSVKSGAINV